MIDPFEMPEEDAALTTFECEDCHDTGVVNRHLLPRETYPEGATPSLQARAITYVDLVNELGGTTPVSICQCQLR